MSDIIVIHRNGKAYYFRIIDNHAALVAIRRA
jgi:hypothetical protein